MRIADYNFWMIVKRSLDLPGQWIAHCLDVDVVSQGNSFEQAFRMGFEAVAMVIAEDLRAGDEPLARRAPPQVWDDELWDALKRGAFDISYDEFKQKL